MTDQLPVPTHLLRRQGRNLTATAVQGLGSAAPPRVSLRQNRFWLVDSAGNVTPINQFSLDVVIVDINPAVSKAYYDTEYDPQASEHAAPACWSDNGVGPSASAQKPQASTCAMCPMNQWGSDRSRVTGKETKACTDSKKIAVIVPGGPETLYLLQVPPASLKHLRAYAMTLSASSVGGRAVDMSDVLTRLSFDPTVQGVLNFQAVGWIDEGTAAKLDQLDQQPETTGFITGTNDVVRTAPIAAPQALPGLPQGLAPALPAPAPVAAQPAFTPPPAAPLPVPENPAPQRGRKRAAAAPPAASAPAAPPAPPAPLAAAPVASGEAMPPVPAFLQRGAVPAAPPAPVPQQFGLAPAPAPDAALQGQIAKAFALPTAR